MGSATSISYPEIGFWVDIEGVDSNVCYHGCGFCTRTKGNAVVTVLRLVLPGFRERQCMPARPLLFWKSLLLQHGLKQRVLYKLDHKLWLSALLSQFYNGEELVLIQPSDLTSAGILMSLGLWDHCSDCCVPNPKARNASLIILRVDACFGSPGLLCLSRTPGTTAPLLCGANQNQPGSLPGFLLKICPSPAGKLLHNLY